MATTGPMPANSDPRSSLLNEIRFDGYWVTVSVENRVFNVLHSLISANSKFFARAFNPRNQQLTFEFSTVDKMNDMEAHTFNTYLNWLHLGALPTKYQTLSINMISEDGEYLQLAKLYRLGTLIDDSLFTDTVMDAFLAKLRESTSITERNTEVLNLPGHTSIRYIYGQIKFCRPLLNLLLQAYASVDSTKNVQRLRGAVQSPFFTNLALELQARRTPPIDGMKSIKACDFHSHGKDQACLVEEQSKKRKRVE